MVQAKGSGRLCRILAGRTPARSFLSFKQKGQEHVFGHKFEVWSAVFAEKCSRPSTALRLLLSCPGPFAPRMLSGAKSLGMPPAVSG